MDRNHGRIATRASLAKDANRPAKTIGTAMASPGDEVASTSTSVRARDVFHDTPECG
jgi:hypothetical protein